MSVQAQPGLGEAAVEAVRRASRQERLVTADEVLADLAAAGRLDQAEGLGHDQETAAALTELLARDPRLASLQGLAGQRLYHCPDLLSRAYARILDRQGSPLLLIAEEVRANSRDYPRPLPLELFQAPVFGLTPEQIEQALRGMAADPAFADITFTATPSGAIYLFSTRHLERGYAQFLAQRAESLAQEP